MRLGITLPLGGVPLSEQSEWVRELSDLGYQDAWSLETGGYDAFSPLLLAAPCAPDLRLGTAIASVFSRGPALLAMQAAALADAAPGRFVLGIGSSSPALVEGWNHATFDRPVERVRDTLRFLRRALSGERVDAEYETFAVRSFRLERPPKHPPPIYVAALRPRMLELAGREADGVLLGLLAARDVPKVVAVARGVRAAPRALEVVLRLGVFVSEDRERARTACRRLLASYLNAEPYARFHRWLGRGEALTRLREAWRRRDRRAAMAAIPDDWVDAFFVHGPAEACRDQIEAFRGAGVDTPVLQLMNPSDDPRAAFRALAPR
jgi:probable F420-dependent oxidoreductase